MKRRLTRIETLKRICDAKLILPAVALTLDELTAALGNNDAAALDRLYADDYAFVGDTGLIMTKAERIAAFKPGDLRSESISREAVSIHLYENTAKAMTRFMTKMASGANYSDGKFLTSLTLVRIKGGWQSDAAHNARTGE